MLTITNLFNRSFPILLFCFYAVASLFVIYSFNGTGDGGDSVQHYLFAKYAPVHPELFFNHWAKPVYVLLASPFAQFGLTGIKLFNAIVTFISIFLTYKIAKRLQLKNAIISALISIFTPLYFVLTFSGLTEPLFALFVSAVIFLTLKERNIAAGLILSFLPFVRSEGLIIIGVFGLYHMIKKQWKNIPLLTIGHGVYALAGFFVYNNPLWVFTQIPYASLSSPYGNGPLFHFVEQLVYVLGIPVYILFWLGFLSVLHKSITKKASYELIILFLTNFFVFLAAHSLFWYFGIFNSMGLKRVFLGMMPVIAIIALEGFNFVTETILWKRKYARTILQALLILYVVIFPFTSNPAAVNWKKDMNLSDDQKIALKVVEFIKEKKGMNHRFIYMHPYLSEALNIDCFDPAKRIELNEKNLSLLQKGDIIVWENWYSVVEGGVQKERLDKDERVKEIFIYNTNGNKITYVVYEYC